MLKNLVLAICDNDSLYAHTLGEYIANYCDLFSVVIFDKIQFLRSYIEESSVDIILINENITKPLKGKRILTLWLLENPPEKVMKSKDSYMVYKYISAEKIIEELRYICGKESINNIQLSSSGKVSRCIGFYSSSGGSGTSSIAISVSRILAMRDKKVLYLNFEDIPSTKSFFPLGGGDKNLSDFLYFLFIKEDQNIASYIKRFTFQDKWGVEAFIPQSNYNDLLQLTCDEIKYFLESLCARCNYDYICIDFSTVINENKIFMLSYCHKVFNIIGEYEPARTKAEIFSRYCNSSDILSFMNTSIPVHNFSSGREDVDIFIEKDYPSFSEKNNDLYISLEGKFGKGIQKIASYIIWE